MTTPRLQLKIILDAVEPPVWRRAVAEDDLNFQQLHKVIQAATGWGQGRGDGPGLANTLAVPGSQHCQKCALIQIKPGAAGLDPYSVPSPSSTPGPQASGPTARDR